MPEGLRLIVTADISQAESALKDIATGAKEAGADIQSGLGKTLDQLGKQGVLSIGAIEDALKQFKTALSVATNPKDVVKLNQAITALKGRLNDLKSGSADKAIDKVHVSSLKASSSALNLSHSLGLIPAQSSHLTHGIESIIHAFEGMKEKTGSTAGALKGLAGVIGTGLGISLLITGVSFLVEKLLDTSAAAAEDKKQFDDLSESIQQITKDIDALAAAVAFSNKLGGINISVGGFSKRLGLNADVVAQNQLIFDLGEKRKEAQSKQIDAQNLNIEKGTEDTKKLEEEATKVLKEATDKHERAMEERRVILAQTRLQVVEDQKDADKKADEAHRKYLELLKKRFEEEEKLRKHRLELFNLFKDAEFDRRNNNPQAIITADIKGIKWQITPQTDDEKSRKELEKGIEEMFKKRPLGIVTEAVAEIKFKEKREQQRGDSVFSAFGAQVNPFGGKDDKGNDLFSQQEQSALKFGKTINGILVPAFGSLIEAIAAGKNPMEAFFKSMGQAVLQLIEQIVQAVVTAAILSAILPGGGGGFGAILGKLLGGTFAEGGLVTGPTLGLVGEGFGTRRSNPEVIAPLDKLKGMLGGMSGSQVIVLKTIISGNNLALVNARTSQSQKRLGA